MFWFDRTDLRAVFVDKRRESHALADKSSKWGSRALVVDPDIQADFTALPFKDESFALVVFDPPHLVRNGKTGWLAKKYGKLEGDWREDLRKGFSECFRVLRAEGTLVFKWNETDVPVSQILELTPERPLFGNRCGKAARSHWIVFMKTGDQSEHQVYADYRASLNERTDAEVCEEAISRVATCKAQGRIPGDLAVLLEVTLERFWEQCPI
jgi:SAM-dependent methyltransferase